jgi:hypothetical protein
MSLITDVNCNVCGEKKHEVTDHSGVCQDCRKSIADTNRRMHMAMLLGMPLLERVKRIEEQLYDLDADRRLRKIEATNATYS